jgi:hypothetical protein
MAVVPLSRTSDAGRTRNANCEGTNWALFAAGGSLLASAFLLLMGNKRAGLVAAAGGTALAVLDQQEVVKDLWNALPGYIDQAQRVLEKVEATVAEVASQRERLHNILTR